MSFVVFVIIIIIILKVVFEDVVFSFIRKVEYTKFFFFLTEG